MRNAWKWILGIVLVLVLCSAIGGLGFLFTRSHGFGMLRAQVTAPSGPAKDFHEGRSGMRMHGGFDDSGAYPHMGMYPRAGMRGGIGFMPLGMGFMFLGGMFRWLVPLGLMALVALGGYALGRRSAARPPASVAAPIPDSPPPAETTGDEGGETPK